VRQSEPSGEDIGIQTVRTPKYPEYSTIEARSRSFSNWTSAAQDSARLAQAGFYYLGSCDEVSASAIASYNLLTPLPPSHRYVVFTVMVD
jgi:hypothetical protein